MTSMEPDFQMNLPDATTAPSFLTQPPLSRGRSRSVGYGAIQLSGLILLVIGCQQPGYEWEERPVFPVEGQVLIRGRPQPGVQVTFHPLDQSQAGRPRGVTDAEGRFRLRTYTVDDGAPAGEYAVTLYWPVPRTPAQEADSELPTSDRLKRRYADPGNSGLRATVHEQPTALPPFEIR